MYIYNGDKNDLYNITTDKFLRINSCGFHNVKDDFNVIRNCGRVDYHILLVNSGSCIINKDGEEYRLSPGNIMFYRPGEPQNYLYTGGSTGLWCHFCGTAVEEILSDTGLTHSIYTYNPDHGILNCFTDMVNKYHSPTGDTLATALLLELLYRIAGGSAGDSSSPKADIITPITTYIHANFNQDITLEQLAEKSGYSKSRFSHIFVEYTGISPIKYLNNTRLNVACEMLEATDISVNEIATHCGFNDSLYFSRSFRQRYGTSPIQYRNKFRNR